MKFEVNNPHIKEGGSSTHYEPYKILPNYNIFNEGAIVSHKASVDWP